MPPDKRTWLCYFVIFSIISFSKCNSVDVRSRLTCTPRKISVSGSLRCRQTRHAVADPWTADLDRRCSAPLAVRSGDCERVCRRRRRRDVVGRSSASHRRRRRCRSRRHLRGLLRRRGGEVRRTCWSATSNPGCCDCASAASTSEVGCPAQTRLEMQQKYHHSDEE